jgi:hypothetical protein
MALFLSLLNIGAVDHAPAPLIPSITRKIRPMTLIRTIDKPVVEGLAVRFSMHNGKRQVTCWVRAAALEKLENNPRLPTEQFLDAFARHSETLEAAAQGIFARGLLDGPNIVIRKENV